MKTNKREIPDYDPTYTRLENLWCYGIPGEHSASLQKFVEEFIKNEKSMEYVKRCIF